MDFDFREYLLSDILPFWLRHGLDGEWGINTNLDREGNPYGYDKNVWFFGRSLYTFSVAYSTLRPDPEYLAFAKCNYEFLKRCEGEGGRLPFVVNRFGQPIISREAYFSETFAAVGCAEYYLATGLAEAKERAERYFDIACSLYFADLARVPSENPPVPETKALGPSMIMLSVCQVMRRLGDGRYSEIAKRCVKEILLHKTPRGLLENVGLSGEFIDSPFGREVNPGHSLEAAWFLMAEGEYLGDRRLIDEALRIVDISMKLGYRGGGIIAFCDCDGNPPAQLEWDMKIWWPQCEALIANRLAYALSGEERYKVWYGELLSYVFARYPDREFGEWFGYMHYDGTLANSLKGNISKGPFHLPRMLMLLDRIERGEPVLK